MERSSTRRVTPAGAPLRAGSRDRGTPQPLRRSARARRRPDLLQTIHRIDAQLDAAAREQLAREIRGLYELEFGDVPLGFMARCHLGPPYVDHRLDLIHAIVEHYPPAGVPPEPFAQARMLVRTGGYAYVEVYASGELRPVFADGSVAS